VASDLPDVGDRRGEEERVGLDAAVEISSFVGTAADASIFEICVTSFACGGNTPFIRGRYHINAIAGEALEAARDAEAALLALKHDTAQAGGQENEEDDETGSPHEGDKGPIHRVEIEAAELVPSHSGRALRGFVAHVHREAVRPGQGARDDSAGAGDSPRARFASLRSPRAGQVPTAGNASRPETHVFADHRDLVSFLRDEFAKHCPRG
jgi:hypothetical protein